MLMDHRTDIAEVDVFLKVTYRFSVIPFQILMIFFTEIGKKKSQNSTRSTEEPEQTMQS